MSFGKFLAILCYCHQRPDRSFFFRGRQFPVCARCTGLLLGYHAGILICVLAAGRCCPWWPLLVLPMVADGGVQALWKVESNNVRRVITGFLGGVGIMFALVCLHRQSVEWAAAVLKWLGVG